MNIFYSFRHACTSFMTPVLVRIKAYVALGAGKLICGLNIDWAVVGMSEDRIIVQGQHPRCTSVFS
jgi:hypothetical protein